MSRRAGEVIGIAAETMATVREAAADAHPNEHMAFFDGTPAAELGLDREGIVVTDLLVMPGTTSSPVQASVREDLVPAGGRAIGSVHSHPNGVLRPSDADLATFGAGKVHVIVGHPYGPTDWRAFDTEGNPRSLEVIDVELPDPEEFFHFDQADIDAELNDE